MVTLTPLNWERDALKWGTLKILYTGIRIEMGPLEIKVINVSVPANQYLQFIPWFVIKSLTIKTDEMKNWCWKLSRSHFRNDKQKILSTEWHWQIIRTWKAKSAQMHFTAGAKHFHKVLVKILNIKTISIKFYFVSRKYQTNNNNFKYGSFSKAGI